MDKDLKAFLSGMHNILKMVEGVGRIKQFKLWLETDDKSSLCLSAI